ncbi:unnamed protein product, partial [Sphacelaria rigidula]
GLALDPKSSALAASLTVAKEAQENERRERWRLAALERDAEEERLKKQHAAKAKAKVEAVESADSKTSSAPRAGKELEASADPLSSFFSEIQGDKDNAPPAKVERVLNDKYTTQELGTPKEQMDRLLQHNYKWKNLNAFDALQLGGDATVEDIKQSYVMKLSTLVHPDKRLDMPQARDAFEEVKKAYQVLLDDNRRKTMAATIEAVHHRVSKERQRKLDKGMSLADL